MSLAPGSSLGPYEVTALISTAGGRSYDISRDGRRFLFVKDRAAARRTTLVVVQNWAEEVKRVLAQAAARLAAV
jgi:hypothetical protein